MRQQIGLGRIDKNRNNPQIFLYLRQPELGGSSTAIKRVYRANCGKIVSNNPQSIHHFQQRQESPINYLEGNHNIMSPYEQKSQRKCRFPKISPKSPLKQKQISSRGLDQQQLLAERARQFVSRIQKQKQYSNGKAVVRKKKQEQNLINKQKQISELKSHYYQHLKESRFNKMMDSILFHEENISQRLRKSISRYRLSSLRSKTEDIPINQNTRSIDSRSVLSKDMEKSQRIGHKTPVSQKRKTQN